PEEMNYATTPSAALNLGGGQTYIGSVNFEKNSTDIVPVATGIGNLPNQELFSVYPNPSLGQVSIKWDANISGMADVKVFDLTGRQVFQQNMTSGQSATLDLSALQSGVY